MLLEAAGLSAEDAKKMMAQKTTGGSSGGGRKTYYVDSYGNVYSDENGYYAPADTSKIKNTDMIDTSKAKDIDSQNVRSGGMATTAAASIATNAALEELLKRYGK